MDTVIDGWSHWWVVEFCKSWPNDCMLAMMFSSLLIFSSSFHVRDFTGLAGRSLVGRMTSSVDMHTASQYSSRLGRSHSVFCSLVPADVSVCWRTVACTAGWRGNRYVPAWNSLVFCLCFFDSCLLFSCLTLELLTSTVQLGQMHVFLRVVS